MLRRLPLLLFLLLLALPPPVVAGDPPHATAPETGGVDPALEAALTTQFGAAFLPALRRLGIAPKDYAYAARLTQAGIQKLQENDFQDARYLLEKAYSLVPSPNVLHWIGLTHLGLDDAVRARAAFLRFLAEAGSWTLTPIKEDLLAATRAQIERLERVLVKLRVNVSEAGAKVYVDGEFVGSSPLTVPLTLAPGPHQLIVIKAGFARHAERLTLDAPGKLTEVKVSLVTEAEHIRRTRIFQETEASRLETERKLAETRRRVRLEDERRRATYARYARVTLIAGAALAAVGLGAGALTWHYDAEVEDAPPDTSWKRIAGDQEKADFFRTTTIAALGMTVLSLGVSTWLTQLAIPPRGTRGETAGTGPTVTPMVSDTAVGLSFGWTF
jgi:hypothetical protein